MGPHQKRQLDPARRAKRLREGFNPKQSRFPKGNPKGGQFAPTKGGGGAGMAGGGPGEPEREDAGIRYGQIETQISADLSIVKGALAAKPKNPNYAAAGDLTHMNGYLAIAADAIMGKEDANVVPQPPGDATASQSYNLQRKWGKKTVRRIEKGLAAWRSDKPNWGDVGSVAAPAEYIRNAAQFIGNEP